MIHSPHLFGGVPDWTSIFSPDHFMTWFFTLMRNLNGSSVEWMSGSCSSESSFDTLLLQALQCNLLFQRVHTSTWVRFSAQALLDLIVTCHLNNVDSLESFALFALSDHAWIFFKILDFGEKRPRIVFRKVCFKVDIQGLQGVIQLLSWRPSRTGCNTSTCMHKFLRET